MEERNMEMKIVGISVAVLVSLVVLAGVLMPVLDDATATTDTFTNEGYFNVRYSPTTDVSLSWDHTDPKKVTVDGDVYDLSNISVDCTLVCGDNWIIRYRGSNDSMAYWGSSGAAIVASASAGTDFTATCSGGSLSISAGTSTATDSYTDLYCIDSDGSFVMKKTDTSAYLNGDSPFYAIGVTNLNGGQVAMIKLTGTIDDGVSADGYRVSSPTFSNISMDTVTDGNHKDLYQLSKITGTITDANSVSTNFTYSYFIVPAEVTAERSIHFTDNQNALLAVIPMLVIIAILIGVVALVIRSRLD